MKYKEILKQIASKGTLIGQCAEIWLNEKKNQSYGKIYILECSEMTQTGWIRELWGETLVSDIRQYAKNYRGKKKPDNTERKSIGETIRNLRMMQRIKQKAFADSVHITQGHLSKIENGDYEPSFKQLEKFSSVLGVPSHKIISGT